MSSDGLPFLPGVLHQEAADPLKVDFKKTSRLDFSQDGVRLCDFKDEESASHPKPLPHTRWSGGKVYTRAMNDTNRSLHPDALSAFASEYSYLKPTHPKDIEKQQFGVLAFNLYYKQDLGESSREGERIRVCVLQWHLDDNSQVINEPKIENSGIPQGTFLRRHRIKGLRLSSLRVGSKVTIYGREYSVTGCNDGVRRYFREKLNITQPANQKVEYGTYASRGVVSFGNTLNGNNKPFPTSGSPSAFPAPPSITSRGLKPSHTAFAQHQHHHHQQSRFAAQNPTGAHTILRFHALWDDQSVLGEKRPFVILYHLEDDTITILEKLSSNCGRSPFPTFLHRTRLPKNHNNFTTKSVSLSQIGWSSSYNNNNHNDSNSAQGNANARGVNTANTPAYDLTSNTVDASAETYYSPEDFQIGGTINVYGRKFLIIGADPYTRSALNLPADIASFEEEVSYTLTFNRKKTKTQEEKDSEAAAANETLFYSSPQVKKSVDFKTFMENDGKTKAWLVEFVAPERWDKDRKFVIKYYMDTERISIFEKFTHNSGFIGGKYLAKSRIVNPATNTFYAPSDFVQGKTVTINAKVFKVLTDAHCN